LLFPILKSGARVVNMSSALGFLGKLDNASNQDASTKLKATLASPDLKVSELDQLMLDFVSAAEAGNHQEKGWPSSTYIVSKVGWSALSRVQQRELSLARPGEDIVLNHVHPGWVDTDMTKHRGQLSTDRGAQSATYAALLPPNTPLRGAYLWHDCQEVDWIKGPLPSAF